MPPVTDQAVNHRNPAEVIIQRFGGLSTLARAYPLPNGSPRPVTTVQSWKDRGRIPQEHWIGIIKAGEANGFTIQIEDFLLGDCVAA